MSLYGIRHLTDSFRTVRRNTIQVAEEIPEADYHYRPAPASRSVAETLVHIAWLADADRFMHEEKRLVSFDGFDLGAFLATSEVEENTPALEGRDHGAAAHGGRSVGGRHRQ